MAPRAAMYVRVQVIELRQLAQAHSYEPVVYRVRGESPADFRPQAGRRAPGAAAPVLN